MKGKTISEIIKSFASGDFPEEIVASFHKWILDEDSFPGKNAALKELWDEVDNIPVEDGLIDDPYELVAEAGRGVAGRKHRGLRSLIVSLAGVAAAVLIAVGAYMAGTVSGAEICYASAPHSKSCFMLPDSSTVWLNGGSKLMLSKSFTGKTRRVELEGEGYFDVKKDPARPFVVHTEKADIKVFGTKFSVMSYKGKPFYACLEEGCISAEGANLLPVIMHPGDLLYEKDGSWAIRKVRVSNFTSWAGTSVTFDEVSAIDIAKSLEHWYNVDISFSDEESMKDIKLSLTVRYEPLDEILGAIELISGIRYRMVDADHVVLFL